MGVTGIDVSHYQGAVDWFAVHAAGASFAFAKASEGLGMVDPEFAINWPAIKQVGLYRGAYHFGHPGYDADAQALHFHSVVGDLGWGDLPPVLDIEASDGHSPASVVTWVQRFVARAESLFSRPVMIYTGGFWRNMLTDPVVTSLAERALWVASYRDGQPLLPRAWSTWTFWQYTDGCYGQPGPFPGVRGPCDRNHFVGTTAQLDALANSSSLGPKAVQARDSPPASATPSLPTGDSTNAAAWPGVYFVWPSRLSAPSPLVKQWQQRMQSNGFSLQDDGIYGPRSKSACMSFQREHGLPVDGIVGPEVWSVVFADPR